MEKHYMTLEGKKKLESELKELKYTIRPQVIKAISEARAHGDLSENAEYHAARERQSFVEGRIANINTKLAQAEVIDPSTLQLDKVAFGATVTLEDTETEQQVTYTIVGMDEADLKEKKISYKSPLAIAMIGKKKGDEFEYKSGKGEKYYKVVKLKFR